MPVLDNSKRRTKDESSIDRRNRTEPVHKGRGQYTNFGQRRSRLARAMAPLRGLVDFSGARSVGCTQRYAISPLARLGTPVNWRIAHARSLVGVVIPIGPLLVALSVIYSPNTGRKRTGRARGTRNSANGITTLAGRQSCETSCRCAVCFWVARRQWHAARPWATRRHTRHGGGQSRGFGKPCLANA